jgi:hypothetical protein
VAAGGKLEADQPYRRTKEAVNGSRVRRKRKKSAKEMQTVEKKARM